MRTRSKALAEHELLDLIDMLPKGAIEEAVGDEVDEVVSARRAAHGGELVIEYTRPRRQD